MKTARAVALSVLIALALGLLSALAVYALFGPVMNRKIDAELPQRTLQPLRAAKADPVSPVEIRDILAPASAAIEASRRPTLQLAQKPMAVDDTMASKLGGRAYWTAQRPYPLDAAGHPLRLLAQLDLATLHLDGFPQRGLLQFFIAADDFYGANLDASVGQDWMTTLSQQKNFRVVYWPQPQAGSAVAPPAAALRADDGLPFDPTHPLALVGKVGSETIGGSDVHVDAVLGVSTDDLVQRYAQAHPQRSRDALEDAVGDAMQRFGTKLGGYPDFTQQDPRAASDRRVLLLQIDSTEGVMWGDSGVANFFIDPDDLARADFSRVAYNWDCY